MIIIDGVTNIENVSLNEAYVIYNLQRVKILIVHLPKSEYTLTEAIDAVKHAKTITDTSDEYITTYYLDGMMTAKEDGEFSCIWMFNPNIVRAEKVSVDSDTDIRLTNLEQTVDTLLGGESDV